MSRWKIYEVVTDADGVDCYIKRGELVRCKECKHWHSGNCWGIPFSGDDASYIETESGDFCSYGQKGDENVETD